MNFFKTVRNALRASESDNPINEWGAAFKALAEDVDTKMASWWEVTKVSELPAAGQPNRFCRVTETGAIYQDNGTSWQPIYKGVPGANPGVLSWGLIGESGTIVTSSGDFTVAKTATGQYEIVWKTAKLLKYTVVPAILFSPGEAFLVITTEISDARVLIRTMSAPNVSASSSFSFVAIATS